MLVKTVEKAKLGERMRQIGGKKRWPGASAYPISFWYSSVWKRIFDLIFAWALLILLAPLMVLVTVAVRVTSKGPILFRQGRMGRNRREFRIMKFRTMVCNGHDRGPVLTRAADPRITSLGRFLRKLKLDELPQLFNVLRGEMSVVGPRPHMIVHNRRFQGIMASYRVRAFIKPGITGMAQVSGYRGEARTHSEILERVKRDIAYVENWSLWQDFVIVLKTLMQVIKPHHTAY